MIMITDLAILIAVATGVGLSLTWLNIKSTVTVLSILTFIGLIGAFGLAFVGLVVLALEVLRA